MPNSSELLELRVKSITYEAQGVLGFDLRPVADQPLPEFTAGAHVDLHLSNGLVRSYSLLNPPSERRRYVLAVNRDCASRGGSKYLHENVRAGDVVTVSPPRNNFELEEGAEHSVFIAGGIGITPILSMAHRLEALGRDWRLHYCARTRRTAAFVDEIHALAPDKVEVNLDGEDGGRMLDLGEVIAAAPSGAHFYCCGPVGMLNAFERATQMLPRQQVHVEYFSSILPAAVEGGFVVELAKSKRSLPVAPGQSILDVLIDAGVEVYHSCAEGICGSCETRVLAGLPDHRDLVLSPDEKASNTLMMVCCSGCKGDKLVLDL